MKNNEKDGQKLHWMAFYISLYWSKIPRNINMLWLAHGNFAENWLELIKANIILCGKSGFILYPEKGNNGNWKMIMGC